MPHPRGLVVTDDSKTTELIRTTLTAEDVDTAGRGADALERFSQQHYDLLISSARLTRVPVVGKPFDINVLRETVRRVLSRP